MNLLTDTDTSQEAFSRLQLKGQFTPIQPLFGIHFPSNSRNLTVGKQRLTGIPGDNISFVYLLIWLKLSFNQLRYNQLKPSVLFYKPWICRQHNDTQSLLAAKEVTHGHLDAS